MQIVFFSLKSFEQILICVVGARRVNLWCLFKEVFSRLTGVNGTLGPWSPRVYQSQAKSWRASLLWGSLAGVRPSSGFDSPRTAPNCQNRTSPIKPNLFSPLLLQATLGLLKGKNTQSIGVKSRKTASRGRNVRPPDVPGGLGEVGWAFDLRVISHLKFSWCRKTDPPPERRSAAFIYKTKSNRWTQHSPWSWTWISWFHHKQIKVKYKSHD